MEDEATNNGQKFSVHETEKKKGGKTQALSIVENYLVCSNVGDERLLVPTEGHTINKWRER